MSPWKPAGPVRKVPDDRGLVEVFLVDDAGQPTKVGLEMYPPDRPPVQVKLMAAEAAALGNALLDGADRAEKENTANARRTR